MHVAQKLQGLHEAGWVHGDLKPSNAIWLPSSNSWTLIDFGSAAQIGARASCRGLRVRLHRVRVHSSLVGSCTPACGAFATVPLFHLSDWDAFGFFSN